MSETTAVPLRPIAKGAVTKLWIVIALVALVAVGWAWKSTATQVAMSQPASAFLAANAKRKGVITTSSGLEYEVLTPGAGPKATPADVVIVDYDGKLADGSTFDSSARQGGPATLPVSGLIPGWVEGLQLMNTGAHYRFWIPPELGYGPAGAGNGVIPANALLVFDVTLHAIAPQQQSAMPGMGGAPESAAPHGGL